MTDDELQVPFEFEDKDDVPCPTCHRGYPKSKRGIYEGMALSLITMVQLFEATNDWVHVTDFNSINYKKYDKECLGDYAKLRFWGMIVQKRNMTTQKTHSGLWKPTQKGIDYARGTIRVPRFVLLQNNKCKGFAGEPWRIDDALGKNFDLQEVWTK